MTDAYELLLQGRRRVVGRLNLVRHSDFDETIEALNTMRGFVEQPPPDADTAFALPGGNDALAALALPA